jgi:iron transport multicopper oxidase
MHSLLAGIYRLFMVGGVFAATETFSNLYIANKYIAPDGFNRSYVLLTLHLPY